MTIGQVLAEIDDINPNTYDEKLKIGWLSELDGRIFNETILTHVHDLKEDEEGNKVEPTFKKYDYDENINLIIPDTYSDVYRHYLMAMIAYANGETERYSNSMIMFNASLADYKNWYNSTHLPIQKSLNVFSSSRRSL